MSKKILSVLLWAIPAMADTWINDSFNAPQVNCGLSLVAPYTSCDVIGDKAKFDAQRAQLIVSKDTTTLRIQTNYGGGQKLNSFIENGLKMSIGDVFFFRPGSDAPKYAYGIALKSHGSIKEGELYRIGGATTTLTANQLLNTPTAYYRRNEIVQMGGSGTALASSQIKVSAVGDGFTAARYLIELQFSTPGNFFADIVNESGQLGMSFAAAICANDILRGTVSAVPEPAAWAALILGLAIVGWVSRKRQTAL